MHTNQPKLIKEPARSIAFNLMQANKIKCFKPCGSAGCSAADADSVEEVIIHKPAAYSTQPLAVQQLAEQACHKSKSNWLATTSVRTVDSVEEGRRERRNFRIHILIRNQERYRNHRSGKRKGK